MTDREIILKCEYREQMIKFFNENVFWMKLTKLENFENDLVRLCKSKSMSPSTKDNLRELEWATRCFLEEIYDFRRCGENNWERFRKAE